MFEMVVVLQMWRRKVLGFKSVLSIICVLVDDRVKTMEEKM
jgi:hypothetical protein